MKRRYFYAGEDDPFMREARRMAEEQSLDPNWPTGVVVVSAKGRRIIGRGANGSKYHQKYGCRRKELGIKTGERYDLCQGCDPRHHAEVRAIEDVVAAGSDPVGAEVYLWGHWWCCDSCWQVMIDAGIKNVYLVKGARRRWRLLKRKSSKA